MNNTDGNGFNDSSSDGANRNHNNKLQIGLRNEVQNQTMLNLPSAFRPSAHFDDVPSNQGSPKS